MRHPPLPSPLMWQVYLFIGILGLIANLDIYAALLCVFLIFFTAKRLWAPVPFVLASFIFISTYIYGYLRFSEDIYASPELPEWALACDPDSGPAICGNVEKAQGLPGKRLRVILSNLEEGSGKGKLAGKCSWTWKDPLFRPLDGQRLCLNMPLKKIRFNENGSHPIIFYNWQAQNIYWRMFSSKDQGNPKIYGNALTGSETREKLRENTLDILTLSDKKYPDQAAAIILALLFGDKYYLSQYTQDNFSSAAIAHSLALSGQHLCIAGLAGMLGVLLIARVNPQIYLYSSRLALASLCSLPFAFIYLWLGNAPPSLLRAVSMLAIFTLLIWKRKTFIGVDILSGTAFLLLLWNPLFILDTGFQLSVLCIAVLVFTAPVFSHFLPPAPKNTNIWKRVLFFSAQILAVSLLIQIALLPVSLAQFQTPGLWFPLNLVWLPLLGFIVLPMSFMGLIFANLPHMESLAHSAFFIAEIPCRFILWLLHILYKNNFLSEPAFMLPHWSLFIVFGILLIILGKIFSLKTRKVAIQSGFSAFLLILGFLAIAPVLRIYDALFNDTLRLEVLDVGQGQAILINFPGNGRILIDGGGSTSRNFDPGKRILAPILGTNRQPALAAVINSHPDIDHVGGLFYLLSHYNIKNLFHNGEEAQKPIRSIWYKLIKNHNGKTLRAGDCLILGDEKNYIRLDVLHPPKNYLAETANDASLILRLSKNGEGLAIIPGDAEVHSLEKIAAFMESGVKTRILIAPHHGSDKNFSEKFLNIAKPEVVLISCGYDNKWDFPGIRLRNWLVKKNMPLLDTSRSGRITILFNEDNSYVIKVTEKKF